jgi:hypothetical protein
MDERWHVWNVPLQAFVDDNDVNLANIERITIGFGEGGEPGTNGVVYIDDIVRLKGRMEDDIEIVDPYAGEPVFLTEDPFVNHYYGYPLFLDPNCPLIEAGYGFIDEYPDLIGKTTNEYGFPDTNRINIGFHYFDWHFVNAGDGNSLSADLNQDMIVNFGDFAVLAEGWRDTYDINDLNTMADEWLEMFSFGVTLNQDPNLVSDVLGVTVDGVSDDVTCYLLMDGRYFGRFFGDGISIPTYEYSNGQHEIKVVGANHESWIFAAPTISINIDNNLQCLTGSETYEYNQAYRFSGFYEGSTISFEIKDWNDTVVWTNSASGNFNLEVPAGVLQEPYNELNIQEAGEGKDWIKDITKEFNITADPNAKNALSLLVSPVKEFTAGREVAWKEYIRACKHRGRVPTICLFGGQATRENIETALKQSGVTLVLIISDGNRNVGIFSKKHRTFFNTADGPYFSCLFRNKDAPSPDWLGDKLESGYSMWDIKNYFQQRQRMYVFIDACKNGTSVMAPFVYEDCGSATPPDNNYSEEEYWRTADMALAFDIDDPLENKIYMGWRPIVFATNIPMAPYNNFLQKLWYKVGKDGQSFESAIAEAAHSAGVTCQVFVRFSWVGNTNVTIY